MELKKDVCRVCLAENAKIPIFGKQEVSHQICSKLSYCLHEKVEDFAGYPKNICDTCNALIESVYRFTQKYKESSRILAEGLPLIKMEETIDDTLCDTFEDNTFVECNEEIVEPDVNDDKIKIEVDIKNEVITLDDDDEDIKLSDLVVKKKQSKKELKPLKKGKRKGKGTNKIASAILEGDFTWLEDKWCAKLIGNTVIRPVKKPANNKYSIKRPILKEQIMIKKSEGEKKPEENPPKLCDSCGQTFYSAEKLAVHKRSAHMEKKPADCPKCNKKCTSKYNLSRHMRRCHSERKEFICSTCGKAFAFRTELTQHNRKMHESPQYPPLPKKKYKCKFCEKSYSCAKSALIHERSVHTGERPAVCGVCGGRFAHEEYLREHMRLHTGDTPYRCPVCGRGYAQRGNMKSHVAHNHRATDLDQATLCALTPTIRRLLKT